MDQAGYEGVWRGMLIKIQAFMMRQNNIIIIGANGYLGRFLCTNLSKAHQIDGTVSSIKKPCPRLNQKYVLNLNRPQEFNYDVIDPGCTVIFTAAISSPDACQSEDISAVSVNIDGPRFAISKFIEREAKVIFCSSDAVYGETEYPASELDEPNPKGKYGEMKLQIEELFKKEELFKAIRLSYVFSSEDKFTKFVSDSARHGKEIELFDPLIRNVVWRNDVAAGIEILALNWNKVKHQVINFGGPESLDRRQLTNLILTSQALDARLKSCTPDPIFFENRARKTIMDVTLFTDLLARSPSSISTASMVEFKHKL